MNKMKIPVFRCVLLLVILGAMGCSRLRIGSRNPFGYADPPGQPDDAEVKAFAARALLPGNDRDENAANWAPESTAGRTDSLEGEWFGRWIKTMVGRATIRISGGRLYIQYAERDATWLLELVRAGSDQVMGRWVNVANPQDHGYYAGKLIGHDRIDGVWADSGSRWDFRRRLK